MILQLDAFTIHLKREFSFKIEVLPDTFGWCPNSPNHCENGPFEGKYAINLTNQVFHFGLCPMQRQV